MEIVREFFAVKTHISERGDERSRFEEDRVHLKKAGLQRKETDKAMDAMVVEHSLKCKGFEDDEASEDEEEEKTRKAETRQCARAILSSMQILREQ